MLARVGHDVAWELAGRGGSYIGRMLVDGEIYTPCEATKRFLKRRSDRWPTRMWIADMDRENDRLGIVLLHRPDIAVEVACRWGIGPLSPHTVQSLSTVRSNYIST